MDINFVKWLQNNPFKANLLLTEDNIVHPYEDLLLKIISKDMTNIPFLYKHQLPWNERIPLDDEGTLLIDLLYQPEKKTPNRIESAQKILQQYNLTNTLFDVILNNYITL